MTIPDEPVWQPLPDSGGITLCNENNIFFPSDFIYCKYNIVASEKMLSKLHLW